MVTRQSDGWDAADRNCRNDDVSCGPFDQEPTTANHLAEMAAGCPVAGGFAHRKWSYMSSKPSDFVIHQGDAIDSRYHPSAAARRQLNKVFPTHWSFLLGEIALYSFVVLLITGVYLSLFFDPSMAEVTYNGVYQPLRGVQMSRAFETALNVSFEVRGGLLVRQIHHSGCGPRCHRSHWAYR
jgi:hypothetical protein